MTEEIKDILSTYNRLLGGVDGWFRNCMATAGSAIACGSGCSHCCRGLFDITLLDALNLRTGFDQLSPQVQALVRAKSLARIASIREQWPDFAHPYVINGHSEDEWQEVMPEDDQTPCVLLDESGCCLVYDRRPMTCRLHGIPLVDVSGEVMDDAWCTMNFTGMQPLEMPRLRWQFVDLFELELKLFRTLTSSILKQNLNELDTVIPAALLIDFASFDWQEWYLSQRS